MGKVKALVELNNVNNKSLIIKGKVYDVISYINGGIIEIQYEDGNIHQTFTHNAYNKLLFEDVTEQYRNDVIDDILS